MDRIAGFDEEYTKATSFITSKTSQVEDCQVYITRQNGVLYCQSNFVTPGFSNPTKIATKGVTDLELIAQNLIFSGPPDPAFLETFTRKFQELHRNKISYFIDPKLIKEDGTLPFRLKGASNLFLAIEGSPPPRRLFWTADTKSPWMTEVAHNFCVKVIKSIDPLEFHAKLNTLKVRPKDVKLVSLIAETPVEDAIRASKLKNSVVNVDSSPEGLTRAFRENQKKTLVILGHTKGANFIITKPNGEVLHEIPFSRIKDLAEEYKTDVIYLGCSAGVQKDVPTGPARPFNPVKAIANLEQAVAGGNYAKFIEKLSSNDLGMVLDPSMFNFTKDSANPFFEITFTGHRPLEGWELRISVVPYVVNGGAIIHERDEMKPYVIAGLLTCAGVAAFSIYKSRSA